MELVADLASWACLVVGSLFAVTGGIGLLRLPDFYTRLHGAGITDTMGAGLVLMGLTFQADHWLTAVKLMMILFFLLLTSPTSAHALSKAARTAGVEPIDAPEESRPSPS